ncbi:MAG: hypothetical protein V9E87_06945 [Gemmatimonadales bacterium]
MPTNYSSRTIPAPMMIGLSLALVGILLGFLLGGAFGLMEPSILAHLKASGEAVLATAYGGDVAKLDAVVDKSWTYLLRAHMHGGAIGSAALGAIGIMLLTTGRGGIAQLSALAIGAGALVYPTFWMVAAFAAPGLGGTGAAKDAYEWIAVPGAGLAILGVIGCLIAVWTDRRTA